MRRQDKTGNITEKWVKNKLIELGLVVHKPVPDIGVDFVITSHKTPNKKLRVQVKGRGKVQKNKRYRWFQIRTTKKQREKAIEAGLPLNESWRIKVDLADVFIFVSEGYHEFWIFESSDIENLIRVNRLKHGNRKDNIDGSHAEIDLDVEYDGQSLTDIYNINLNIWGLITNQFT